jgi:hypothetical protein
MNEVKKGIEQNPVYRQDFTLSIDRDFILLRINGPEAIHDDQPWLGFTNAVERVLDECCEKYVFQVEAIDDYEDVYSNFHVQGRVNLKHEMRWRPKTFRRELIERFEKDDYPFKFYRIYTSATSKGVGRTNFDYCMKPNTRFKGPFSKPARYLGRSILNTADLLPWHRKVVEKLENYDTSSFDWRTIYHVLDFQGHNQKSSLVRYLLFNYPDEVGVVNTFGNPNQLATAVHSMGPKKLYLFDLSRNLSWIETIYQKDGIACEVRKYHPQWDELCNFIEKVKDGCIVSSFYGKHEVLLMDPPLIFIFSNWPLQKYNGQKFSEDRVQEILLSTDPCI